MIHSFSKARALLSLFSLTDIFPDVIGTIEGEAIVETSFHASPLRRPSGDCVAHPDFQLEEIGDMSAWRTSIHNLLSSTHTRKHIRVIAH